MKTKSSVRSASRGAAFTLIELLVVITIIIFLVAILAKVFLGARQKAAITGAKTTMNNLRVALKSYNADVDFYPGHNVDREENASWTVYEALCGKRKVDGGGGGPNAPYYDFRDKEVGVEVSPGVFKGATLDELEDPEVKKYILDPWGMPFQYRENDSAAEKTPEMHNRHEFDMYSFGPNRKDDEGEPDDVTNWSE